ncbi:hypothetical protein DPMN_014424 [Dreissena polymorpha]|uniref:Uncharacterized protein n=1 Tax=Dreissena polymorpha TaxID=45954 RepID=A0A9D4N798_DREPO|nr:hypothetical protein DPMN_014424 [Dreissena polymorpha]
MHDYGTQKPEGRNGPLCRLILGLAATKSLTRNRKEQNNIIATVSLPNQQRTSVRSWRACVAALFPQAGRALNPKARCPGKVAQVLSPLTFGAKHGTVMLPMYTLRCP